MPTSDQTMRRRPSRRRPCGASWFGRPLPEGSGGREIASWPSEMDDVRVTSIELFFDLVFVFTITQLTSALVAEPDCTGVAKVVLIFGNIWWMYGGYA